MNVRVACETYLCVTTKKVWLPDQHTLTHGQTDAEQSDPYIYIHSITGFEDDSAYETTKTTDRNQRITDDG